MKIELIQLRMTPEQTKLVIDFNFLVEEKTIPRRLEYDRTREQGDEPETAGWKLLMFQINKILKDVEKEVNWRKHGDDWEQHMEQHENGVHPDLLPILRRIEEMST